MSLTILSYYIFIGLAVVFAITLIVQNRRKAQREQAEVEARLGLNRTPTEPPPTVPGAASSVINPTVAASMAANGLTPDPYDMSATPPVTPSPTERVLSSGPVAADRYAGWVPPEPKTWSPDAASIYNVSWANSTLFGKESHPYDDPNDVPKVTPDQVPTADTSDFAFGPVTPVLAAVLPTTDSARVGKELMQAGYYQPHAVQNLAATRFLLAFIAFIGTGAVYLVAPRSAEPFLLGAVLLVPVGLWALPRIFVQNQGAARKSEVERAMPDMLDMLNMCVSQGLTIPQSLKRISKDLAPVYPILAAELAIVTHQSEVGNLNIALENFAERVEVPEVDSFTTLMNQSERMGTSISTALTQYSNTMRESLRQRIDEKANKASFKLMFPTVLFMMPAVFAFLMGPAVLELQTFIDNGGAESLTRQINPATNVMRNRNNAPQQ